MSRHLPAAPPDAPGDRRPVPPLVDDEPPPDQDLSDLDDLDDLDDFDGADWPDDEPLEELELDDPPLAREDDPFHDMPDDEPDDDALLETDAPDAPLEIDLDLGEGPDLAVLPWQVRVGLPELGIELPAVLDPTSPVTTWLGGALAGPLVVRLGGETLTVDVAVEPAERPSLRVGRDVLSGRFVVGC